MRSFQGPWTKRPLASPRRTASTAPFSSFGNRSVWGSRVDDSSCNRESRCSKPIERQTSQPQFVMDDNHPTYGASIVVPSSSRCSSVAARHRGSISEHVVHGPLHRKRRLLVRRGPANPIFTDDGWPMVPVKACKILSWTGWRGVCRQVFGKYTQCRATTILQDKNI